MLTVLCLEDSPQDVEIMRELLVDAGYDLKMDCTAVEKEFVSLLRSRSYDIILSDFKLPGFDGFTALRWAMEICPDVPFICVSGTIGEERAVELLKQGAVDYVIKDRLARLPAAIKRALDEAQGKKSRRQAEEALHESELKLRTVADFTNDWEYWEKENQEIAYISPSCERITGYSPQEFMADPALFGKIVHPEDVDLVKKSRERVFTTEHKHDVDELEFRIIHKNGSVVHIYHVCRPIFDVSDQYHGRRISNRDVTERKRAEEELKKSESKFRAIFDNTSDGIFLVDLNAQKFFMCNAICMKMLGYTQEEFLTLDIDDIHPSEDLAFINEQIGKFSRGEEGLRSDIRFKRKDGSIFYTDLRPTILTIAEKKYLLINFNDITERKRSKEALQKSEEQNRAIITQLPSIVLIHKDGKIAFLNQIGIDLLGYSIDEIHGRSIFDFLEDESKPIVARNIQRRISGEIIEDYEAVVITKSNDKKTLMIKAIPITYEDGFALLVVLTDITERKLAEEKLQESEEIFNQFLTNSPVLVYVKDEQYKFKKMSKSFEDLFSKPTSELVGKDLYDLIPPELAKIVLTDDQAVLKNGIAVRAEEKLGDTYYTSIKFPIHRREGSPDYLGGFSVDITERKRAEEALFESETKYRTLVAQSPDGIFIRDLSGTFISVNKTMCDSLKYTEEELLSMKIFDIVPQQYLLLHKDRLAAIMKGEKKINEAAEYEVIGKDGIIHCIEVRSSPYYKDKEIIGFQGVARDITERKQAEKQIALLAHTLKSVAECVSITDLNDIVLFVNDAFLKTYGYNEHEILGKNINVVRSPNNPPEGTRDILTATLAGGWSGELMNRTKDGRDFPVLLSTSFVRDEKGQDIALVGVATDITEHKRAEEELKKSEEKYRSIFENVQDVYYETLLDGTILEVSPSVEFISKGQYHREDLIGKSMYEFYPDTKDRDAIISAIQKTGSVTDFEVRFKNRDGSFILCSISARIKLDAQGRPEKIIGSMHDITERKRTEEAIKEKARELERFNDLMTGRELKMVDLKKEINELLKRSGEKEKYRIVEQGNAKNR